MSDFVMRDFNELSAGQHQKIAIVRGLAQTPKLLILDEPTSNLDVRHQIEIADLLRDIARQNGMIILMICHDLNIASKFSDNLIMMARPGRIYAVGKPGDLLTEQAVRDIYGVDCRIIDDEGSPHVILGRPLKGRQ